MHVSFKESLEIFGISGLSGQTEQSLRTIYHKLAPKFHPDRGGKIKDFIRLREAYSVLKRAVKDSSFEKDEFKTEFTEEKESTNTQETPNNDGYYQQKILEILQELERYRQAYTRSNETIYKYENIFNDLIQQINDTRSKINHKIHTYNKNKDDLKEWLEEKLLELEKKYRREWWQFIVPVKKISQEEYVLRNNAYVEKYNEEMKKIDQEFMDSILEEYKQNFEDIIDLVDLN